jgi:hypothetical protein
VPHSLQTQAQKLGCKGEGFAVWVFAFVNNDVKVSAKVEISYFSNQFYLLVILLYALIGISVSRQSNGVSSNGVSSNGVSEGDNWLLNESLEFCLLCRLQIILI